jgi:hypothetical protein
MKVWLVMPTTRVLIKVETPPKSRQFFTVEESMVLESEGSAVTDVVGKRVQVISKATRIPGKSVYQCDICIPLHEPPL